MGKQGYVLILTDFLILRSDICFDVSFLTSISVPIVILLIKLISETFCSLGLLNSR